MRESRKIEHLHKQLTREKLHNFPKKGYTEKIGVPPEQGIYIIYDSRGNVLHVGRTQRGKRGLRQRLNNHLLGQSSFVDYFLDGQGSKLRNGYKFRYLVIDNARERTLLEALAIGKLCPKHLGTGENARPRHLK